MVAEIIPGILLWPEIFGCIGPDALQAIADPTVIQALNGVALREDMVFVLGAEVRYRQT